MRTSSRPTLRSIPAIPAARWSTSRAADRHQYRDPRADRRQCRHRLRRAGQYRQADHERPDQEWRRETGPIGIRTQDLTPDIASSLGIERADGALIAQVAAGSAAADRRVQAGDLIVGIDDAPVHSVTDLHKRIDFTHVGDVLKLSIVHEGEPATVKVTIETTGHRRNNPISGTNDGRKPPLLTANDRFLALGKLKLVGNVAAFPRHHEPFVVARRRIGRTRPDGEGLVLAPGICRRFAVAKLHDIVLHILSIGPVAIAGEDSGNRRRIGA